MAGHQDDEPGPTLADLARGPDRMLGLLILLAGGLLAFGWLLPIMTVKRLLVLSERISIMEGAWALWDSGNYLLFAVIVVFSILFPLVKLLSALALWYGVEADSPALARSLHRMEIFGRWSMLDVFVVALTVVAIEVSLINDVVIHGGIYAFTAGVILSILVVQRITYLAKTAVRSDKIRDSDDSNQPEI